MPDKSITQERLKELLHYDPDTGIFTRNIRTASCVSVGDIAGNTRKIDGYHVIRICGQRYPAHRLAFLYMEGSFPPYHVDHINHIRNDNRWCNLRRVKCTENLRNRTLQSNNTSGINGVNWHKHKRSWEASIRINKKRIYLGAFKCFFEACCARKSADIAYGFHSNHGS